MLHLHLQRLALCAGSFWLRKTSLKTHALGTVVTDLSQTDFVTDFEGSVPESCMAM